MIVVEIDQVFESFDTTWNAVEQQSRLSVSSANKSVKCSLFAGSPEQSLEVCRDLLLEIGIPDGVGVGSIEESIDICKICIVDNDSAQSPQVGQGSLEHRPDR